MDTSHTPGQARTPLHDWAEQVARKEGFEITEEIYRGHYYTHDHVRNVIFGCEYEGKPAVLKIWDDPRHTDEPKNLEAFLTHKTSELITAPQLYAYEMESPKRGWMVIEELPEGEFLKHPLSEEGRDELLRVYVEYKTHWPKEPLREPLLWEQMSAVDFHTLRISRWFEVGQMRDAAAIMAGEEPALIKEDFLPRWETGMTLLRERFEGRPLEWIFGHFKAPEIFKIQDAEKYYLIDFAHSKFYPVGYEFGFLVWADQLTTMDVSTKIDQLQSGVEEWIKAYAPIAQKIGLKDFDALAPAALVERCLGTVLADVAGSDRPLEEKRYKLGLLYELIDYLTTQP